MSDNQTLRTYLAGLEASTEPDTLAFSRSLEQMPARVASIIRKATRSLEILSRDLDPTVYGAREVVEAAWNFLNRNPGAKVSILVEQEVDAREHPLLRALAKLDASRVEVALVPPNIQKLYNYSFILADGKHGRFQQQRDDREGLCIYNSTRIIPNSHARFGELKLLSVPQRKPPFGERALAGDPPEMPVFC